ncbi:hypothetical protein LB515_09130 [Mesorhizobium sp. CA15]|uniref:hypothetical protein n=1 Tax=Mesorhizobium sp. CA15 TaxID=2876641 RepID=UPI001CD04A57|nr:hypothetical protein [Mesorhizobium sp. CA15]MBZ9865536.1 hypothetical protein [Mesorhizobium sp. CA15]
MTTGEDKTSDQTLQCLTTEHFVLQTARSATIQEANSRADLFLTAVSSATVALAFVAQVTRMGQPFVFFSLILLPCLYFIGIVTFVRAVQVAIEDMVLARGMARIRHYFVETAPGVEKYLIHSRHDDDEALIVSKALHSSHWQSFMSTAGMVSVVASVIAGVFAGVLAKAVAVLGIVPATGIGMLVFAVSVFALRRYQEARWNAVEHMLDVRFPSTTAASRGAGRSDERVESTPEHNRASL